MNTDPILCRGYVAAPINASANEIVYLPAGIVEGVPSQGNKPVNVQLMVTPESAKALEEQRRIIASRGDSPFFDFNHDDDAASFRVTRFDWREGVGVIASGEWTKPGRDAIEGKAYRGFSPVCHVDDSKKRPACVVCHPRALPNMGGLVNNPAFKNIPAFFAKQASDSPGATGSNQNQNQNTMNEQELAALRAKIQEQNEELIALKAKDTALKAKNETDAIVASQIAAKEAQLEADNAKIELEALKGKSAKLEADAKARAEADADAAVQAAVSRGAIAAKDEATKAKWKALIASDASASALLAAIPGAQALGNRITGQADKPKVERGAISARDAIKAYRETMRQQIGNEHWTDKRKIAQEAGAIWAADIRTQYDAVCDMPIVGDNSIGTAAGVLVTMRSLELLKYTFPMFSRITTDFSSENQVFNTAITTHYRSLPTIGTYTTSYAQTDQASTPVSVTIDAHKYLQTTFGVNVLAGTMRNLFEEYAEGNASSLAADLGGAVYDLITTAFTNTAIVAAQADFGRSTVIDVGVSLTNAKVPKGAMNRTLLLNPTYYGQLAKDNAIVTLAAFQNRGVITTGMEALPQVHNFTVMEADSMDDNSQNLVGFGFSKSALILATRLPTDYTQALPGASFGNVMVVTNPDTGFSMLQTEFVDHTAGSANQRVAWMRGQSRGQIAAGTRITSA